MKAITINAVALFGLVGAVSTQAELLVYEPFDYTPDEILTGKGGATGTTGTWSSYDFITGDGKTQDWFVHAEGTTSGVGLSGANPSAEPSGFHRWDGTVDNLPTSGGYVGLWGADDWNDDDPHNGEPGRNMDANIGLDPAVTASFQAGTTTWFSYVAVRGWDRNEETPSLIIGSDPTPNDSRAGSLTNGGSGFGTGGGPPRGVRTEIYPMYFSGGNPFTVNGQVTSFQDDAKAPPADGLVTWQELDADNFFGAVNIVVGKIEWDAGAGGEDIISVARFLEEDTLSEAAFDALIIASPNLSSANWAANKPDLDQSTFDTLSIAGLKFFVDEVRIATTFDEAITGGVVPSTPAQLIVSRTGANLEIEWGSQSGMLYNLRSVTDPSSANPKDWPIYDGNLDLVATPPANSLSFALPADTERYFVVEEFPAPPVSVFSDDFETDQGWTASVSDANGLTNWERGAPSVVGPTTGANGSTNCFGTNLASDYDFNANISLRSPAIDLTGAGLTEATLTFQHFPDIEGDPFDSGTIRVLMNGTETQLGADVGAVTTPSVAWVEYSAALPPEAIGQVIQLEFLFISDDVQNLAGWYIDDVLVTTPAP